MVDDNFPQVGGVGKMLFTPQLEEFPVQSVPPNTDLASSSCSTEGTLQLVIQNFRHMSDTVRGPSKYIQSVPWYVTMLIEK